MTLRFVVAHVMPIFYIYFLQFHIKCDGTTLFVIQIIVEYVSQTNKYPSRRYKLTYLSTATLCLHNVSVIPMI